MATSASRFRLSVAHARGGAERGCDGREHGDHNVDDAFVGVF